MRAFGAGLAVLASLTTLSGVANLEVRGTALVRERPEPNAVVWLEAPNAPSSPPTQSIVLDQRNLTFYPHVLAVRVGTTVEFPNNDRVFHNVFSFKDGKRFDLGMYPVGTKRKVTFDQPGVSRVFCNIHPNMAAYVVAVDTPYFGVTDQTGTFRIPNVPPGSHKFGAWRPGGSILTGKYEPEAGSPFQIRWP